MSKTGPGAQAAKHRAEAAPQPDQQAGATPTMSRHDPARRDEPAPAASDPTPISRAVYTVVEVAEMLDLSPGSTYALVRAGEIPAKKMGGRWVIPKRRFHTWLDELPQTGDAEIPARGLTQGDAG
jgi:excisionase family DNA binding protein